MKKKRVVVLDFDGTLIPTEYVSLYNVIDQQINSSEYKKMIQKLRSKYLKITEKRKLTLNEQLNWFNKTIEAYTEFGLTLKESEEIMATVKLRNGVKECLEFLKKQKVPVAIISYGIKQFISTVLKSNNVDHLVSQVYSADLTFKSKKGLITGFRNKSLVLPSSKVVFSHQFADIHNVKYQDILGVGDSIHDDGLGDKKENRFGISHNKDRSKLLKRCMGTVVITKDFYPVTEWLYDKLDIPFEIVKRDENEQFCAHPDCGKNKVCPECNNSMPRPYRIGN